MTLTYNSDRLAALIAVHDDQVRYHTGLSGPSVGYTWSEGAGGRMFEQFRHTLQDLWSADLIDVDTHRLFAQHGHRVTITTKGYVLMHQWRTSHAQPAAA
jgi:hypothetical protein